MNTMPKFYDLETMTQEDLNKLALERNTYIKIIDELEKYLKQQMEYYKSDVDIYVEYKLTLDKLKELKEGK